MSSDFLYQLHHELDGLDSASQAEVLAFVRSLKPLPDRPRLERIVGAISLEELAVMQAAIEEGCERIDVDEW